MPTSHLRSLNAASHGFAVFPEIWLKENPEDSSKKVQHLLFGDYITPPRDSNGKFGKWNGSNVQTIDGVEWVFARCRKNQGWVRASEIQLDRILEVNFIDVGQGDGCHIVTPNDEQYLIDAGESDNMFRFLKWRFNLANPGVEAPEFTAIISHPDQDHFLGFKNLFKMPEDLPRKLKFKAIYHNGLIQQAESYIGESVRANGKEYRTIVESHKELIDILEESDKKSNYEEVLTGAKETNPRVKFSMLYRESADKDKIHYKKGGLTMEVLGPIPETVQGKKVLRWFGDTGKTKNGHSIIIRLVIGKLSMLLGGDLNSKSADYLMEHYSGKDISDLRKKLKAATDKKSIEKIQTDIDSVVEKCRAKFQTHVAKSCHHGSHDITNELLDAMNPIATIISSGDEESFCHPRPETLGAIGKYSRGERPLIYSTELARSSPEYIELKKDDYPGAKIKERIVVTYGMINVRSDGEKLIIAQKLEAKGTNGKEFQIEKLEWDDIQMDFIYK